MTGQILNFLKDLPPEIATMVLAMLPVSELRVSIPIGIKAFGLQPIVAFLMSVIGTTIPAIIVLRYIKPITEFISNHSKLLKKLLDWIYLRVHKKLEGKETLEGLALALFVAIPFPGTGAWTGSIAAFLIGLSFKKAFPFVFLGIVISGLIVTLISTGVFASIDFIL